MPRGPRRPTVTSNRTDQNTPTPATPTGLPYGQNAQLQAAQRAVPVPRTPPAPPGGTPTPNPTSTGAPGGAPPPGPDMGQALQDAQAFQMPQVTSPGAPTERPNEPVTAGSPSGPGPGPAQPPDPLVMGAAVLNNIPAPDPATAKLRAIINAQVANGRAP